jgi:hypothetical protein
MHSEFCGILFGKPEHEIGRITMEKEDVKISRTDTNIVVLY